MIIVNADHWDNKTIKIDYVCSRISEEIKNHVYARFDNFSNDLYKIWRKYTRTSIERIKIINCIWIFVKI